MEEGYLYFYSRIIFLILKGSLFPRKEPQGFGTLL